MKAARDSGLGGGSPRLWGRRPTAHHPGRRLPGEAPAWDHHHRSIQGGGARAAVFGVTDGLVSNVCLILAFAGANPGPGVVRLAGVGGLIAGAFSMGGGEWVSMRVQRELLERELALEQHEIRHRPEGERRELVRIYENRGVEPSVARTLASEMMRTPELALETHAREELGISPASLGNPLQAALSSFGTFALGALLPLIPWLVTRGTAAVVASVVIGAVAALAVGASVALFTHRGWWWTAVRQVLMVAGMAAIAYGVGTAVGVANPG
ncbi:MAG TPA: VIT1/CCC1 transporter family protein [Acidimicrobiales bacterium]|nr:VIT1/CCC1 transporter family protein [Acidimicrobiales bacterium]